MTLSAPSGIALSHPDWSAIDDVLLDLDGTLLDQAYDNHIWRDLVPQRFAAAKSLEPSVAHAEMARRFAARSGFDPVGTVVLALTLARYCADASL